MNMQCFTCNDNMRRWEQYIRNKRNIYFYDRSTPDACRIDWLFVYDGVDVEVAFENSYCGVFVTIDNVQFLVDIPNTLMDAEQYKDNDDFLFLVLVELMGSVAGKIHNIERAVNGISRECITSVLRTTHTMVRGDSDVKVSY